MDNTLTQPLLSIIIPCYNAGKYIEDCIKSISLQNEKIDYEIILINDASDDMITSNICTQLVEKYKNIKLINLSKNIGQANARNKGLEKASGQYINFIDADDTVNENLFKTINATLKKYKQPDVIVWGALEHYYDEKDCLVKKIVVTPNESYFKDSGIIPAALNLEDKTLFGYVWNKIYKSEIIKSYKIKFENKNLIEDYLFNLNFFKKTKTLVCINKVLYNYSKRVSNNTNVTSTYDPEYFEQHYYRIETFFNWLNSNNILNHNAKAILANRYLRYSISAIWRNKNPKSKMNAKDQKTWLKHYFTLPMTKELIHLSNPNGFMAKISSVLFKRKLNSLILLEANLLNIANKKSNKIFNQIKKSR